MKKKLTVVLVLLAAVLVVAGGVVAAPSATPDSNWKATSITNIIGTELTIVCAWRSRRFLAITRATWAYTIACFFYIALAHS